MSNSLIQDVFNDFEEIIRESQKHAKLKFIGYLTIPIIIGFFILRKVNRNEASIIFNLRNSINECINELEQKIQNITKHDSYLIYFEKNEFSCHAFEFIGGLKSIKKQKYFPNNVINLASEAQEKTNKLLDKINHYNEEFITREKKEYAELFKKGNIVFDNDQQTAVITDDKHNLVIAGAGSGKTEVLTTKIAYITKRKSDTVKPERILALAFQNKAALEIKERLKKRYGLDVEVRTFHSLGWKIITEDYKSNGVKAPKLKEECSNDLEYQEYIQNLYNREIKEKDLQDKIIPFMENFGDNEIIKAKKDFKKKKEYYEYQSKLTYTALNGKKVKSKSEKEILNFFLNHNLNGNKIDIVYENPTHWMKYEDENGEEHIPRPDFYFPDFGIYLEHWAIDKNGKVPDWFSGKDPTREYIEHMNIKKMKYRQNKKFLIETTQAEYKTDSFFDNLKDKFLETLRKKYPNNKFELKPLFFKQLIERIWRECKEFINIIVT